jgi:ferrous iron transport protein B
MTERRHRHGRRRGQRINGTAGKFERLWKFALVGCPNTGKSVIFNNLSDSYATVSNYPGTTVEVSRGKTKIKDEEFEIVDTPGMYSLFSLTEDERVARKILLKEKPDVVLQLVDAKNLERMLPLTFQLVEADLPLILDLNLMDEAERVGMKINVKLLEKKLGIPVVTTVATTGKGMKNLESRVAAYVNDKNQSMLRTKIKIDFGDVLEKTLGKIESILKNEYILSKRSIGLLLLQGDNEIRNLVRKYEGERYNAVIDVVKDAQSYFSQPLNYVITMRRNQKTQEIMEETVSAPSKLRIDFREKLSRMMMKPLTGIPILLIVLYFGLYQFVGVFGAQILVEFLEEDIFGSYINPFVTDLFLTYVQYPLVQELFVGEFGIITLGVRYAIALILPIVGTFFIAFSILEDTGYLPRLAMLVDRIFKKIGLNGRAIIPIVLGFGCGTMASIVTRTLESKREQLISILLLAFAIPCSAQLGVILGLLTQSPKALLIWGGVITASFLFVGFLSSKILPGEKPSFYMEIPPLRMPKLSNILLKTYTRLEWYFLEVFPLFILASILIWLGQITGIFQLLISGLEPLVITLGLPKEAAISFLFGFFRRDYGAAGLFDLQEAGLLSEASLVVSSVTLTLFLPCIAQFSVIAKERGLKTALVIAVFIFPFAFLVGYLIKILVVAGGGML